MGGTPDSPPDRVCGTILCMSAPPPLSAHLALAHRRFASVAMLLGMLLACLLAGGRRHVAWAAEPERSALAASPETVSTLPALSAATNWPRFELKSDRWWSFELPRGERFDASALLRLPTGEFLTLSDQQAGIYRLEFPAANATAGTNVIRLQEIPDIFVPAQLSRIPGASGRRLDCEGLAQDEEGRLYVCEEALRWIFRWNPKQKELSRLEIDWAPVSQFFHVLDYNASFEGLAIGGDRLYVANERQRGRLIVLDLKTLRIVDHFTVKPADATSDDTHFSDLCWAEDSLWALLRDVRKVLRIDVTTKRVLSEFDYAAMETARPVAYGVFFAPGFMEGLAVEPDALWLLSDNNGIGRRVDGRDIRPILFRCPRPDRVAPAAKP